MVNWHNFSTILKDYIAFIKLNHAIGGIYIWETVFTAGFEFDVLRRKRPYRWTIWLYLGTRYTGLLTFICFFLQVDNLRVHCQPLIITTLAMGYSSWAFASFIIILRVIAIWKSNVVVSVIAIGVWLGGIALNIRNLALVDGTYSPIMNSCMLLHAHQGFVNGIGVLVVDVVLLLIMLIGLLRDARRSSIGIWKLLYQQCIIWIALACFAEIPPMVFYILNLNDAWNQMLLGETIAILSIGAARMYRSLCDYGSLTEYGSVDAPKFASGTSNPTAQRRGANVYLPKPPILFPSVTQWEGTRTMHEAPTFPPTDHILEIIPGGSTSSLTLENTKDKADSAGREAI